MANPSVEVISMDKDPMWAPGNRDIVQRQAVTGPERERERCRESLRQPKYWPDSASTKPT